MSTLTNPFHGNLEDLRQFWSALANLNNEELRSALRPLASNVEFALDVVAHDLIRPSSPAPVSIDGGHTMVKVRSATWASLVSNLHVDALIQMVMWYGKVFDASRVYADQDKVYADRDKGFRQMCHDARSHFIGVMEDASANGVAGDGKTGYKLGLSCHHPSGGNTNVRSWAGDLITAEIKKREGKEPVGSDDGVTLEQIVAGVTEPAAIKPFDFNETMTSALNEMFKVATGESVDVKNLITSHQQEIHDAQKAVSDVEAKLAEKDATIKSLSSRPAVALPTEVVSTDGSIPSGTIKWVRAWEPFCPSEEARKNIHAAIANGQPEPANLGFDIPTFDYGGKIHPNVPAIDPHYVFDMKTLAPLLWALAFDKRAFMYGPSGTGKTTEVHQVAARLFWPIFRVNLDSEMSRMDLIGRETLTQENGTTVSQFVEGVLPTAMQAGAIFEADEVDFGRSDVMYAFQSMLEEGGTLRLTEDGGRVVQPHPMFRVVATANTKGQGDETGCYQGARVQSAAFLDRFTVWIGKDYLEPDVESGVIRSKVPAITDKAASTLVKIAGEIRKAFVNGEILTTVSPRGLVSAAAMFTTLGNSKDNLHTALRHCISGRCTDVDYLKVEEFIKAHIK